MIVVMMMMMIIPGQLDLVVPAPGGNPSHPLAGAAGRGVILFVATSYLVMMMFMVGNRDGDVDGDGGDDEATGRAIILLVAPDPSRGGSRQPARRRWGRRGQRPGRKRTEAASFCRVFMFLF